MTENTANEMTFKEQEGLPANANAKRLAREKKNAQKAKKESPKFEETVFTLKAGKIVQLKVKPGGTHSSFVGLKRKLSKEEYQLHLKKWQSEGVWIEEDDFDEKIAVVKKRVCDKYEAFLKANK